MGQALQAVRVIRTIGVLACALVVAVGSGCSTPPALTSSMNDDQVRATLAQDFSPGMSLPEVQSKLDDLHISQRYRTLYPRTESRPQVLLARLFPPGGFWLHTEDDLIKYVDVSFVFDAADRLERFPIYRDSVRYFHGEPVYGPTRRPMVPIQPYPASPPLPADPLEKAE
jgi:hypothetical protein